MDDGANTVKWCNNQVLKMGIWSMRWFSNQVLKISTWSGVSRVVWVMGLVVVVEPVAVMGEPGLVMQLREGGAVVRSLGVRGGLEGYFVELADGDAYALYVTGDGHAVTGLLYAPDGSLVTGLQLEAAGVGGEGESNQTDEVAELEAALDREVGGGFGGGDARARFEAALGAFGFELGDEGPVAVVFADPGCRWSREAVARLGQEAMGGRFKLKVVPVGLLGGVSARLAVGIASAASPALAWFENRELSMVDEGYARIDQNNALYESWGEDTVPLLVYRDERGVAFRVGIDDDMSEWMAALR